MRPQVIGVHLQKYIARDRNKSLYMIFQQHPYEATWGRYKLVILINRNWDFYKESAEISGLESKTFRSVFLLLDHVSKRKYTQSTKFKHFITQWGLNLG